MAPPCGTKAKPQQDESRTAGGWIRALGFYTLAGAGIAILAAVVLAPPYERLRFAEYRRDLDSVRLREARQTVDALDRLTTALPEDEVLTERQAGSVLGLYSSSARTIPLDTPPSARPGELSPIRLKNPPAPQGPILRIARRLRRPALRRAMLVLSGCMMLSAFLLFASPTPRPRDPWKNPRRLPLPDVIRDALKKR